MNNFKRHGFTLIELMLTLAIIGVLSTMALPKFADMVRRSREATTKGNLGTLRSALSIYAGDNEGVYTTTLEALTTNRKYLSQIPTCWTVEFGNKTAVINTNQPSLNYTP